MTPKVFFPKKLFQTQFFFQTKIFVGPKFFFGPKILLDPKFCWTQNFFGRKIFSDPKLILMKMIFGGIKQSFRTWCFLNCPAQRFYLNWSLTLKTVLYSFILYIPWYTYLFCNTYIYLYFLCFLDFPIILNFPKWQILFFLIWRSFKFLRFFQTTTLPSSRLWPLS